MKTWLQFSIATVLALFGAACLLDTLRVAFKGDLVGRAGQLSGHSGVYFSAELNLFLGVTLLLGAAAIYRVARRVKQG